MKLRYPLLILGVTVTLAACGSESVVVAPPTTALTVNLWNPDFTTAGGSTCTPESSDLAREGDELILLNLRGTELAAATMPLGHAGMGICDTEVVFKAPEGSKPVKIRSVRGDVILAPSPAREGHWIGRVAGK